MLLQRLTGGGDSNLVLENAKSRGYTHVGFTASFDAADGRAATHAGSGSRAGAPTADRTVAEHWRAAGLSLRVFSVSAV